MGSPDRSPRDSTKKVGTTTSQNETETLTRNKRVKVLTSRSAQAALDEKAEIGAESDEEQEETLAQEGGTSLKEKVADRRNQLRVERADAIDHRLTSKYLPGDIVNFLPDPIPGPDDNFTPQHG